MTRHFLWLLIASPVLFGCQPREDVPPPSQTASAGSADNEHAPRAGDGEGSSVEARGHRSTQRFDDLSAYEPMASTPAIAWAQQQKLFAQDAAERANLGSATALQGSMAVLGAPGSGTEAVYVFTRSGATWTETAKLTPTPTQNTQQFGVTLDLDGPRLVVGAPWHDDEESQTGAAYVFAFDGLNWNQEATLRAPAPENARHLGNKVAISGDTILVGARDDDELIADAGAAYVFERSAQGVWSLATKLMAPDGARGDDFGISVALHGDTLAVGASRHDWDGAFRDGGAVYVYQRSAGTFAAAPLKLQSPAPVINGHFGRTLSLHEDSLLIGESKSSSGSTSLVRVFVRQAESWVLQASLPPPEPAITGYADEVAIEGDRALVGSPYDDIQKGRVDVFSRTGTQWAHETTLLPPTTGALFGRALALDNERALVGSVRDSELKFEAGAAFVFTLVGGDCTMDDECGSGSCTDGVCCDASCKGGCARCDTAGSEGICAVLGAGESGSCTPLICDGVSLVCPPCSNAFDCASGHWCDAPECKPQASQGEGCGAGGECLSGHCVDGVCCESACGAQCLACDVVGSLGSCTPVMGSPHGRRPACAQDQCAAAVGHAGSSCLGGSSCEFASESPCKPYRCGETQCRQDCQSDEHCSDGSACDIQSSECRPTDPICTDDGLVLPDGSIESCSPYICSGAGTCLSACTSGLQCAADFVCSSAGRCVEAPLTPQAPTDCSCRVVKPGSAPPWKLWTLLFAAVASWRMRRRVS